MGDLNIDLFKTAEHRQTSIFLNIMYSHSFFPLITKLTRVTGNSATLIDHIFTTNFETNVTHTQGIYVQVPLITMLYSTLMEICMEVRAALIVKTIPPL